MTLPHALALLGFAILGIGAGMLHFISLRWNARLYLQIGETRRAGAKALAINLLRIALTAAVFIVCARAGAAPLLLAFAGWLLARQLLLGKADA